MSQFFPVISRFTKIAKEIHWLVAFRSFATGTYFVYNGKDKPPILTMKFVVELPSLVKCFFCFYEVTALLPCCDILCYRQFDKYSFTIIILDYIFKFLFSGRRMTICLHDI